MNCEEFLSSITDFARDGTLPDEATVHCADCQSCAARLAEQRELTGLLRKLAASDGRIEAPPEMEAQLVEAFRAPSRGRSIVARVAVAIAAAGIIAVAAFWTYRHRMETPPVATQSTATTAAEPSSAPLSPQLPAKPAAKAHRVRRSPVLAEATAPAGEGRMQPAVPRKGAEEMTGFVPLPYGSVWRPITGGQIVRIRLPRSALQAAGLPVNENRVGGEVDADVLLGDDMTARAIRFVREVVPNRRKE